MPSLRPLRRKIVSIESTRKITVAMKMVSAAKLRKAVNNMEGAKPYAEGMIDLMGKLSGTAVGDNPYLSPRGEGGSGAGVADTSATTPQDGVLIVVLTSDRGLCGGFNAAATKRAVTLADAVAVAGGRVGIYAIGKNGFDYFRRKGYNVVNKLKTHPHGFTYADATSIGDSIDKMFVDGDYSRVLLVRNEYRSTASQVPVDSVLLPISPPSSSGAAAGAAAASSSVASSSGAAAGDAAASSSVASPLDVFDFEPEADAVLSELIPRYIRFTIYFAVLESLAGENGARMVAMDAASRNAKELLESTKSELNKARQSNITGELLDIINGVQALA